jgi:hypothetical protein
VAVAASFQVLSRGVWLHNDYAPAIVGAGRLQCALEQLKHALGAIMPDLCGHLLIEAVCEALVEPNGVEKSYATGRPFDKGLIESIGWNATEHWKRLAELGSDGFTPMELYVWLQGDPSTQP